MPTLPETHWHVRSTNLSGDESIQYDLNLETLQKQVVMPFKSGKPFMVERGNFGSPSDVKGIQICQTSEASEILRSRDFQETKRSGYTDLTRGKYAPFSNGKDYTRELLYD